jgi:hypothetical protein
MKNKYWMLVILTTCAAAQSALAIDAPGWDRPLRSAELKIVEATGILAETKSASLLMKSQDGAHGKVSFVFTLDQQAIALTANSIETDNCGSVIYTAVPTFTNGTTQPNTLRVMDNTNRVCRDARAGTWEIDYEVYERTNENRPPKEIGHLSMTGEPQVIFTIQKMPVRKILPLPIGY